MQSILSARKRQAAFEDNVDVLERGRARGPSLTGLERQREVEDQLAVVDQPVRYGLCMQRLDKELFLGAHAR